MCKMYFSLLLQYLKNKKNNSASSFDIQSLLGIQRFNYYPASTKNVHLTASLHMTT